MAKKQQPGKLEFYVSHSGGCGTYEFYTGKGEYENFTVVAEMRCVMSEADRANIDWNDQICEKLHVFDSMQDAWGGVGRMLKLHAIKV